MTDTPHNLAKTYAVMRNDGVVIDRVLASDEAYEAIDWESRYPDCSLELDEDNLKPIGYGAPVVDTEALQARPPSLQDALALLAPEQRDALTRALADLAPATASESTDE